MSVHLAPPPQRFRPQSEVHMSKRIEQSRRHGHHDPRHLVLVPQDPPTAPDEKPKETVTGSSNVRQLPEQASPGPKESVRL